MTFDWTINLGHVFIIVNTCLTFVGIAVWVERRLGRLEVNLRPLLRAFEGNGEPGLLTRVTRIEDDVEAHHREARHAFRNFEQVCVLRHEKLTRERRREEGED